MGTMRMGAEASSQPAFSTPKEICPYAPTLPPALRHESFGSPTLTASFDELQTYDAVIAQTESKLRISRSRSRQKRGPPTIVLS